MIRQKISKRIVPKCLTALLVLGFLTVTPLGGVNMAQAQTLNPFSPDFRLSVCDGPHRPGSVISADNALTPEQFKAKYAHLPPYVDCDFKGLLLQVQFLINAMIVLGVLAAIATFTYAGVLYLTGSQEKIKTARNIFKKVGFGFLMMLTAWFIVYQGLEWLKVSDGVRKLLGNP